MASRAAARAVEQEEIEAQFRAAGPVGTFFYFAATTPDGTQLWKAAIYVARIRAGGLMFCLPAEEEVVLFFEAGGGAPEEMFVTYQCECHLETPRGRALGEAAVLLVDCGWGGLSFFRRPGRGDTSALIRFKVGDTVGRPVKTALEAATDQWVTEAMDEDTAAEYMTGIGGEEGVPDLDGEPLDAGVASQLLQRLEQLERRLGHAPPPAPPLTTSRGQVAGPSGLLGGFDTAAGADAAMERLKMLAGAGPTRLGAHERQSQAAAPEAQMLAEHAAEAVEVEELDQALEATLADATDPMQKLMLLQMKQMALMNKSISHRQPSDPIQALLGSGGGESQGGSTSGIKGCLAREAYVKITEDLHKLASVAESNAMTELGLSTYQVTPGIMRDYLERRVPLAHFRQLTQFGYLAASGWEIGARTNNKELQGFCAKLLMFVEQTALDSGRTNLSWLMTGLADPNFALTQQNTQKSGLKPFTRLASASWVAANVSYLRDLDFLESKIRNNDKGDKGGADKGAPDLQPRPKYKGKKQKPEAEGSGPKPGADKGSPNA